MNRPYCEAYNDYDISAYHKNTADPRLGYDPGVAGEQGDMIEEIYVSRIREYADREWFFLSVYKD